MDSNLVQQGCPSDGNEPIDGTALRRNIDCHDDLRRMPPAYVRPDRPEYFGIGWAFRCPQHFATH